MRLDIEVKSSGARDGDPLTPRFIDRSVPIRLAWNVADEAIARIAKFKPGNGVAVIIRRAE